MNHIYFCDTVPLKAFAKVLGNGCWLPRVLRSDSPRGIIPLEDWLAGVCYPSELDLRWCATLGRYDEKFGSMTPWVWYSGEIDSPGYHTPARLNPCSMILYPRESCFGGFFIDSPGYDTQQIMLLYCVFLKNLVVLFIVSFESDEIETSIFLKIEKLI